MTTSIPRADLLLPTRPSWESIAESKRSHRWSLIPPDWRLPDSLRTPAKDGGTRDVRDVPRTCGVLTDEEVEITEMHVGELVERLRKGSVKCRMVVEAFCKRAAVAQQLVSHRIGGL
jgi:amidase